jgi:hypothetical protein
MNKSIQLFILRINSVDTEASKIREIKFKKVTIHIYWTNTLCDMTPESRNSGARIDVH